MRVPKTLLFVILPFVISFAQTTAPSTPRKQVQVVRVNESVSIDGILSESVWHRPGVTDFTQRIPNEGAMPSQKTEVWVAYDNEALYVAARMYDAAPDSIIQILGRRDADVLSDLFEVFVDPYHDRRNGYYFAVSAAGTMLDGTMYNDDWSDDSWDGVWETKTNIDDKGWTVEMKIPYSQLHFLQQDTYVWGINFRRVIGRLDERSFFVVQPRKESGFVSRFADLVGIENVVPPQQLEVLPYVTTRAEYKQHAANDPFNSGSRYLPGMGADLKVGLGTNLTLNATVNPDFGQVEVDPAVVNLSDVETFFQEKRPFFLEGANTFRFGQGGSTSFWGFNWAGPNIFYSRRIGRAPQGSLPSYDYADLPVGTHILGAGKLTGKMGDNWNVGMIHAVTAREFADIQTGTTRDHVEVEPITYYGIGRIQKDFNDSKQGFGVISTYTARSFQNQSLRDQINSDALVGGVDGWTFLDDDKTYVVAGWAGASRVSGNQTRMIALQHDSRHYFQRPDASHVRVDSSATSMTGYAGRLTLNKQKGPMMFNAALGIIDPKFDVNDLGFLWRTDIINFHIAGGYQWTERTEYYNNVNLAVSLFGTYDFDGNKTWGGYWTNGYWEFPNFYNVFWSYAYNPPTISTRSTRGGPAMLNPLGYEIDLGLNTDSRKSVELGLFFFTYQGGGGEQSSTELSVQFKPAPNISLSVGPSYSRYISQAQWVDSYDDPFATATFARRFVFADLDQTTLSTNIRLNWTFTPRLSLQLFAQPLISAGAYRNFKAFASPRSFDFSQYGDGNLTVTRKVSSAGDATYTVDADGSGPAPSYDFSDPDFNFKSLRGNAVLRWEYRPGSTLYFVWTQSRSDQENNGDFQFSRSFDRLISAHADNIFMIKFTYWWNM